MTAEVHAAELPRLDAFDEEFGQDPVAILRAQRRKTRARIWTLIAVVIAAAIIGALALAWSTIGGRLRLELQPAPMTLQSATREAPSEEVWRLHRQVDALNNEIDGLKNEIRNLTQAQQEAAATIAALEADAQNAPSQPSSGHWYSNPETLTLGIVRQSQRGGVVLPPRRPATARPANRKVQRRDNRSRRVLELPR